MILWTKFLHFWCEVEKHLLSQDAVDTLLDGLVSEGVQKFRTPLGYTLSRTLYSEACAQRCFSGCGIMMAELREPAIHPEGNAIHGLVEGTISSEMVF